VAIIGPPSFVAIGARGHMRKQSRRLPDIQLLFDLFRERGDPAALPSPTP
jgi:hypothetical protein